MSDNKNLPTLQEIVEDTELSIKQNNLMVLVNQNPPEQWLKAHPILRGHKYLPIERVEYLLSRVYTKWWVEVLDSKVMANSVTVTVRLFVVDPITGEVSHNDGIGAAPIQTKSGASATDWEKVQTSGVQMAAPMAKTYAFKDAAECFGKLFGKDVARDTQIDYSGLVKQQQINSDMIKKLLDEKRDLVPEDEIEGIELIIDTRLEEKYEHAYNYLRKLK